MRIPTASSRCSPGWASHGRYLDSVPRCIGLLVDLAWRNLVGSFTTDNTVSSSG